jgi:hypothetical protein
MNYFLILRRGTCPTISYYVEKSSDCSRESCALFRRMLSQVESRRVDRAEDAAEFDWRESIAPSSRRSPLECILATAQTRSTKSGTLPRFER